MSKISPGLAFIILCISVLCHCGTFRSPPHVPTSGCQDEACFRQYDQLIERGISSTLRLHVRSQTFSIGHGMTQGTGTIVAGGRMVLTANHVIRDAVVISGAPLDAAMTPDHGLVITERAPVRLYVLRTAPELDVALLVREDGKRFDHPGLDPLNGLYVAPNDRVWHFGQITGSARGTVITSSFSARDEQEGVMVSNAFVFTAECEGGDSGGPVTTASGFLVGIVVMRFKDKLTYAVPIGSALQALNVDDGDL